MEKRSGIPATTDGTFKGLLHSMEQSGVDLSVILPVVTKPSQFDGINAFAKSINDQSKGEVLSFGGIHPESEKFRAELGKIKELGLPGIKLHPDYQGVMIDDKRYMDIIRYADELGLIILVHAGIDIGLPHPVHCPPVKMKRVIDEIKPKKLILAHMGGWKQWEEVYELLAGEDVYFDTAFTFEYIDSDMFKKLMNKHGSDKILYATDSPWSDAKKTVETLKRYIGDERAAEDILSHNAINLLKI